VAIIGLYSNALEGPGVISPGQDRQQVAFLTDQLTSLKADRSNGKLAAVILAVHHPSFSADNLKPGSEKMLDDIDGAVREAGLIPDAVLSGHAHNYQRFIREWPTAGGGARPQVPFIIAGSGGHNALDLKRDRDTGVKPAPPITRGDHTWDTFLPYYGYLRVIVDARAKQLTIEFNAVDARSEIEQHITQVDLTTRKLTANTSAGVSASLPSRGERPGNRRRRPSGNG
jgi:hypothetical protein